MELSSKWKIFVGQISLAQSILAVNFVWQTRNIFFRLCSGNSDGYVSWRFVSWRFVFLRSQQSRIRFCLHLYQQTTLLIIEKGSFTWVRIKLIWLLIFWPPWLPQLAFHHRCLRPHLQDDNREIENSWWVKRIEKGCCWIWQGWMLHDNIGAVVM